MKKVVQILFGIGFLVFGLNKFMGFMPTPELEGQAAAFMNIISGSYIHPLMGATMILTGLSAILNKYTALMLVIFAPIMLNIMLFHFFYAPESMMVSMVLFVMHIYLLVQYKASYSCMLKSCSGMNCKTK